MSTYSPKLVFSESSTKEDFDALYELPVGSVFKVQSDFETVMRRIEEYKPEILHFEVFPINAGTSLYTLYGPDHCVVVENNFING